MATSRLMIGSPGHDVLIGIGENELKPLHVDFAEQSHLIVLGEAGCGKTAVLRLLCRQLIRTNTADEAQLEIVDFRRTLLGVVESKHLTGYAMSPASLAHGCRRCQQAGSPYARRERHPAAAAHAVLVVGA